MSYNAEITLDLVLILRLLVALFFGIFYAVSLEISHTGRNLRTNMTTLAVAIGIGVDLAIAYNAPWWTTVGVVAVSSIGIIGRSLLLAPNENESDTNSNDGELGRYKLKWVLDDLDDCSSDLTGIMDNLLQGGKLRQDENAKVGQGLGLTYEISAIVNRALEGRYEQRKKMK